MIDRRRMLVGGAALALSGCRVLDGAVARDSAMRAFFARAEGLTYRSQRLLAGNALAPEFTMADIRQGQRPNGSVNPDGAEYRALAAGGFVGARLTVTGLVEREVSLAHAQVLALPARSQITRHDCVEGWSCIAKWTGVPLSVLLDMARPLPRARFAVFHCHDAIERSLSGTVTYYESIDMADARHPQTILAWGMNDAPLPVANGAPFRLRVERQLGYKMAKYVHTVELVEDFAGLGDGQGSYWADRGYEWYAGI
jgi:DMSO/TMAO reductase YedYZ molybdopterin-dependent catalytic subunit